MKQRRAPNGQSAAIRPASPSHSHPATAVVSPPSQAAPCAAVAVSPAVAHIAAVATAPAPAPAPVAAAAPCAAVASTTPPPAPPLQGALAPPSQPPPPLHLAGVRSHASGTVFKLVGHVGPHRFTALLDSGASGSGFISPAFAEKCGLALAPSASTVQLADGTIVSAAGQVTIDYTLSPTKGAAIPFTSQFTATPLESYDIILGVGWLEQHDVKVG